MAESKQTLLTGLANTHKRPVNLLQTRVVQVVLPWLLPALLLLAWQAVSTWQLLPEQYLRNISSPWAVVQAGWGLLTSGELWGHLGISAARAAAGLLVGGVVGLTLGVATGLSPLLRTLLDTTLQMLRNIPHLALVPLVILWFGIDESAKVFLVALGTFFPIYLNTFHGIRNVDASLIEMAQSYGLKGSRLFKEVILPGALPSVLVGLRFSLGIMWLTLIVAETIYESSEIDNQNMNTPEFFMADVIIFTILVYAALGFVADWIARQVEKRLLRWNPAYATQGASK